MCGVECHCQPTVFGKQSRCSDAVSVLPTQVHQSTFPLGVPADFLEMQCNAVRKLQSWFRRKVDNSFGEKQDDSGNHLVLPAADEETLGLTLPAEAETQWVVLEPKRPPSAYFLFVKSCCRQFGESGIDYSKRVGAEWSVLSHEQQALWSHSAVRLEETFRRQREQYRRYGKYEKVSETQQGPSQATSQSSEELPEYLSEYMREAIDSIVDRLPDGMPQCFDVPAEVRQSVAQELKAMFPDNGFSRQGVVA